MVAAWAHHSDTRRSRQRRPALPALAVAAMLAAALTGCTLGQEPQARSTPAPVLAPSAQAATGNIPEDEPMLSTGDGFHSRAVEEAHRSAVLEFFFDTTKTEVSPFLVITDETGMVGAQAIEHLEGADPNETSFPRDLLLNASGFSTDRAADLSRLVRGYLLSKLLPLTEAFSPWLSQSLERIYITPVAALVDEDGTKSRAQRGDELLTSMGTLIGVREWALFGLACGWASKAGDFESVFAFNGLSFRDFTKKLERVSPDRLIPYFVLLPSGRVTTLP